MIYIFRALWLVVYVPVYVMESFAFLLGVIIYPFVAGTYHVKHGTTKGVTYKPEWMAKYIDRQYQKLGQLIEKLKDDD